MHVAPARLAFVLVVAGALACAGGESRDDAPRAPDTAATKAEPVRADTTAERGPFTGTLRPTVRTSSGLVATLVEVRAARRTADHDRVVFEFAGDVLPGYAVEYVPEARACGSGSTVPVAGAAQLVVRLRPARAHGDEGASTINARTLRPDGHVVREMTVACDFEATVTWVLGVDERRAYRVRTLASPPRLVLDVARN